MTQIYTFQDLRDLLLIFISGWNSPRNYSFSESTLVPVYKMFGYPLPVLYFSKTDDVSNKNSLHLFMDFMQKTYVLNR